MTLKEVCKAFRDRTEVYTSNVFKGVLSIEATTIDCLMWSPRGLRVIVDAHPHLVNRSPDEVFETYRDAKKAARQEFLSEVD